MADAAHACALKTAPRAALGRPRTRLRPNPPETCSRPPSARPARGDAVSREQSRCPLHDKRGLVGWWVGEQVARWPGDLPDGG